MEKSSLPISQKNMTRVLLVLCVILALAGGFFHAERKTSDRRLKTMQDKYTKLEEKYNKLLNDAAAAQEQPKAAVTK